MKLYFLRSRLKSSIVAGVLSALVTGGLLYLHSHRTQAAIVQLRRANDEQSLKLLRRKTPEQMPDVTPPMSPSASIAPVQTVAAAAAPLLATYRNEGQATPVATLQTFAWACDNGDVATVATLLTFERGGRAKVAAYIAQLPEAQRAQWRSPEELAATVCIGGFLGRPYPPADAIELATLETISADRVRLRLPGTALDGGNYQKTSEGWKFLILDTVVEERLKALAPTM